MANVGLMQLLASGKTSKLYYDYSETQQFFLDGVISPVAGPSGFSSGFSSGFGGSLFDGGTGLFMVSPQVASAWIQSGQAANVYYNPFGTVNAQRFTAQPSAANFGPPQ